MGKYANKKLENKKGTAITPVFDNPKSETRDQVLNNHPAAVAQTRLQEMANNSSRVKQLQAYQAMADNYVSKAVQRKENSDKPGVRSAATQTAVATRAGLMDKPGKNAGAADIVQLRAANLPAGYNKTNEAFPVYFNSGEYAYDGIYDRNIVVPGPLTDFVRNAAQQAGNIGSIPEIVNATRFTNNAAPAAAGSEKWITSAEDMGKGTRKPHSVEPFNVKFSGSYGAAPVPISITYHFGNYNNGYIMAQSENANHSKITEYPGGADGALEYSNAHANTDDEYDTNMNDRMTGPLDDAKTWDARTILGGEGARFEPVRTLHANGTLLNNSKFFSGLHVQPAAGNEDLVAAIDLSDLWGIWTRRFPGQFNINAATIGAILRRYSSESSDKIVLLEYRDLTDGQDFDLDRNAVH